MEEAPVLVYQSGTAGLEGSPPGAVLHLRAEDLQEPVDVGLLD